MRGGWPGRSVATSHRCMAVGCGWHGWRREAGVWSTGHGSVSDAPVVQVRRLGGECDIRVGAPAHPHQELCVGACGTKCGSGVPPSSDCGWTEVWCPALCDVVRTASFPARHTSTSLPWGGLPLPVPICLPPATHHQHRSDPSGRLRADGRRLYAMTNMLGCVLCCIECLLEFNLHRPACGLFSGCGLSVQTRVTGARRLAHRILRVTGAFRHS